MVLCVFLCLAMGYLLGCIQTGFIIGKINHIDIRDYGSGNSGTTNTLRTLGKTAALLTFLGDSSKGLIAVNIARYILIPQFGGMAHEATLWLVTGFAVVIGHNFPFYLHFKGGKGIATTGGVIFAFDWRLADLFCCDGDQQICITGFHLHGAGDPIYFIFQQSPRLAACSGGMCVYGHGRMAPQGKYRPAHSRDGKQTRTESKTLGGNYEKG